MKVIGGKQYNWRLWGIIALLVAILVLLVIFAFYSINKAKDKSADEENETDQVDTTNNWETNENFTYGDADGKGKNSEDIQIVVPTSTFGGTVTTYDTKSTFAELVIGVGGNKDKSEVFQVETTSIVYDAKTNQAVIPSSLKTKGMKIRVLATSDAQLTTKKAEVVIINDDLELMYTPVSVAEVKEGVVVLKNELTETNYYLTTETPATNALTGDFYDKTKFSRGDRVFIYPDTPDKIKKDWSEEGYNAIPVKKAFVYPTPYK